MRNWAFWEWVAYGCLFMAAIIMAAETGFKTEPEVMAHLPDFFRSPNWGFAPVILVISATVILLLREFISPRISVLAHVEPTEAISNTDARGQIAKADEQTVDIRFEPQFPYIKNEIINGHGLSTVLIGLKAIGRTFSNCRVYVEKVSPAPSLPGLPILLVDGAQMLRPDDPETRIAVAWKWDHVDKYRFSAPLPPMDSHLWDIKDDPPRLVEIKVTASSNTHEFQKTALFRIRVDEQKKLFLERE